MGLGDNTLALTATSLCLDRKGIFGREVMPTRVLGIHSQELELGPFQLSIYCDCGIAHGFYGLGSVV